MTEDSTPATGRPRARPTGAAAVAEATLLLRQHTDAGWTAIESTVIERALAAFRPSAPVRGRHDLGDFFLASDVVVARLREAVDGARGGAAQRITCTTGEDDRLETVTVQLVAAYGPPLLELSERVHAVALATLQALLGELAPPAEGVLVHVHIGDVSDDPRIVD